MTAPQPTYSTRRRLYDKNGQERQRVKRCPTDRAVLTETDVRLSCPECGWAADREQVTS